MSSLPVKSVRQSFEPNSEMSSMMETFRQMVNHCIRIGLENNCSTLKRLSNLGDPVILRVDVSKLVTDWGDACIA